MTPTERIVKWNEVRGLLEQGYNAERESAFILEELYELLGFKGNVKEYARKNAKCIIYGLAQTDKDFLKEYEGLEWHEPTDQDILDGLGDLIVFATGAMAKKLLEIGSDKTVDDILNTIMDANDKKGSKVDSAGKILKDEGFQQPNLTAE